MSTVIHRLYVGAFSGVVERHDDGPWSGWYSFTWNAGPVGGGRAMIGKSAALSGLNGACLDYFAKVASATHRARHKIAENH